MKKYIPLENIVDKDKLSFIDNIENNSLLVTESKIREKTCYYYTASRRQLWQAVGLEYIEPELLDYIDGIEEDAVFFDVGASNGIFSIYAANSGLQVFSFEPEAQNFSLLELNNYLNRNNVRHKISTFNIALSDCEEVGNMYMEKYEAGGHLKILDRPTQVQSNKEFQPEYIQNVLKYNLDGFIKKFQLPQPEYMKIDVDGAEGNLLNGCQNTFSSKILRSIFIELDDTNKETAHSIELIMSFGFKINKKIQVQNYDGLYNYIFLR